MLLGATGGISASVSVAEDPIFFIGKTETIDLGEVQSDIIKVENLDNIICTEQTKIITTAAVLSNSNTNPKIS